MKIRKLTPTEKELVEKELSYFKTDFSFDADRTIVLEGMYKEVFLVGEDIMELLPECEDEMIYAGIKLGETKDRFRSSLEFGTLIFPSAKENRIVLSEKASELFLYGRDIFKENLPKKMPLGRKLVGRETGEFLGFGIYDGRMLNNVIDKGAYLRKYC
ncbi:MAG: NIP7 pre-PUA domain-containing protein [Candidatus Methanofastidiosia archaeon]